MAARKAEKDTGFAATMTPPGRTSSSATDVV